MRTVIIKCYDLDKVLYKKVLWKDLIQAYRSLKRVNDITQVFDLDFWNTFVVISRGNIRFPFIVTCYAGVLEDEEEVTIYSEHCETFGSAYGKIRINKQDLSIKIEPMDFVPDMSGYYHIFGKKLIYMAEIFNLEEYNNKKKQEYYFEYDCGDGIFSYKITFNKPVTRKAFMNMMEKAGKVEEPYSVLRDKDFQMKHHIKKFEQLPIDYQDVM